MNLLKKIEAFVTLGHFLRQFEKKHFVENTSLRELNDNFAQIISNLIDSIHFNNPWFTPEFVRYSFASIAHSLERDKLERWKSGYPKLNEEPAESQIVGVIMAGNIPLVGFHDFICVLLSGHIFFGRLSTKDDKLLPAISKVLIHIEPEFRKSIQFTEDFLKGTDAIIATGSDNSSRYFEHYFAKNPHIIRKNRNSVAILIGNETTADFKKIADDMFIYFGLGCRNVSKIFIPEGYDITHLIRNLEHYSYLGNHHKFANNYDYLKALYLVNQVPHLDSGFFLLKEDPSYNSPIACLYYEYYNDADTLLSRLKMEKDQIQCIATKLTSCHNRVRNGSTQKPMLWDYADNVDVIKFLLNLSEK